MANVRSIIRCVESALPEDNRIIPVTLDGSYEPDHRATRSFTTYEWKFHASRSFLILEDGVMMLRFMTQECFEAHREWRKKMLSVPEPKTARSTRFTHIDMGDYGVAPKDPQPSEITEEDMALRKILVAALEDMESFETIREHDFRVTVSQGNIWVKCSRRKREHDVNAVGN